jgi:outer membrane protein OmpA-like peptidoglycan-associated protein
MTSTFRSLSFRSLVLAFALVLSGCGAELNLTRGVTRVASDLSRQLGPAPASSRTLVIDPVLDSRTGQQTNASARVQELLAGALGARMKSARLLPFDGEGAKEAQLLVTGSITALPKPGRFRMSIALTDRSTGIVVAQAGTQFREDGLDVSPTRFYRDSPSLVRDRSIDGYLRTAETEKGNAADVVYIEQVPTSALLADALAAYNEERWEDALSRYTAAVQRPDGHQLRTFNGIYLCNVQLGRMNAAGEAFDKIAALGLATSNLAVKLLFRPGSTNFWPDPKVSGPYPMWLNRIARAAKAAGSCLNVVGHTSKSGSEEFNDRLSLQRATAIRAALEREAPGLTKRFQVSGVGSRQNLVGSGTDDASDAVDRRVEFKVVSCEATSQ